MAGPVEQFLITCPSCGTANRIPPEREGQRGKCGGCHLLLPPVHAHPVTLDDRTFDGFVLDYPGSVLAEFWAPW